MNYKFKITNTKYGDYLQMDFVGDGNISILSNLFNSTNMNTEEYKDKWISSISKVISGKTNKECIGIEAFDIDIEKDKTYIYFEYPADGEHEFELSTSEFKEILIDWFYKLDQFEKYGKILS